MESIPALVIGGIDYGEADRIVFLLTSEGRMNVFASAAKKSRRRFGGALEPFQTIQPQLKPRPRGDLVTLLDAQVLKSRLALREDLGRIGLASYLVELSGALAPAGAPAPELFALTEAALDHLCFVPATRLARRAFELALLGPVGFFPELERCVLCGESPEACDLSRGGSFCAAHSLTARRIGPKTRAWMRAQTVAEVFDPSAGFDAAWAQTAAEKAGPFLDRFYANLLGHPLQSSALLRSLDL